MRCRIGTWALPISAYNILGRMLSLLCSQNLNSFLVFFLLFSVNGLHVSSIRLTSISSSFSKLHNVLFTVNSGDLLNRTAKLLSSWSTLLNNRPIHHSLRCTCRQHAPTSLNCRTNSSHNPHHLRRSSNRHCPLLWDKLWLLSMGTAIRRKITIDRHTRQLDWELRKHRHVRGRNPWRDLDRFQGAAMGRDAWSARIGVWLLPFTQRVR